MRHRFVRTMAYFLGCAGGGVAASALAEPCGEGPALGAAVFAWALLSLLHIPPPSPVEHQR